MTTIPEEIGLLSYNRARKEVTCHQKSPGDPLGNFLVLFYPILMVSGNPTGGMITRNSALPDSHYQSS